MNEQDTIYVEDATLRNGFTIIPNAIIGRRDISAGAKLAYVLLLSYAWQKGSCFPGQLRMSEDMGVTDRTIRTYLRELETVGLVITRQRGLNQTNVYILPKTDSNPDRKKTSGQDRKQASAQDRKILPTKKTQNKNSLSHKEKNTDDLDDWQRVADELPRSEWLSQDEPPLP